MRFRLTTCIARLASPHLLAILVLLVPGVPMHAQETTLFADDFESGLDGWRFPVGGGHEIVDAGEGHGLALSLVVRNAPAYALIDGSERWGDVRIEGEVLFPSADHSYLGFIYRYQDDARRIDFGSLYIKNNGNYIQANEHHDTDVGRTFLPEIRSSLEGERAIVIGAWQRFALEIRGSAAHLYVGDLTEPAITIHDFTYDTGAFGFKPRNPGTPVWLDDIVVRPLDDFTYQGPPIPDPAYDRSAWVTDWSVLGPLAEHVSELESGASQLPDGVEDDGRRVSWRPMPADHRGAVLTGRVVEFREGRRVAYYRATVEASADTDGILHISTVDDLAIWVNGDFAGFTGRHSYAWWDAIENEDHPVARWRVSLRRGPNEIVVRVVGGGYAAGGFYLGVREGR